MFHPSIITMKDSSPRVSEKELVMTH